MRRGTTCEWRGGSQNKTCVKREARPRKQEQWNVVLGKTNSDGVAASWEMEKTRLKTDIASRHPKAKVCSEKHAATADERLSDSTRNK